MIEIIKYWNYFPENYKQNQEHFEILQKSINKVLLNHIKNFLSKFWNNYFD